MPVSSGKKLRGRDMPGDGRNAPGIVSEKTIKISLDKYLLTEANYYPSIFLLSFSIA